MKETNLIRYESEKKATQVRRRHDEYIVLTDILTAEKERTRELIHLANNKRVFPLARISAIDRLVEIYDVRATNILTRLCRVEDEEVRQTSFLWLCYFESKKESPSDNVRNLMQQDPSEQIRWLGSVRK